MRELVVVDGDTGRLTIAHEHVDHCSEPRPARRTESGMVQRRNGCVESRTHLEHATVVSVHQ
jgi:hypothetical protein